MNCLILLIFFTSFVLAHVCIHDKLAARRAELAKKKKRNLADEERKRKVLQTGYTVPSEFKPIRIKMDYSFLAASNDTFGICRSVGDWAKLGDPGNEDTHKPECGTGCDGLGDTLQTSSGGCSCWYKCTEEDVFFLEKRDNLIDNLFPKAVDFLQRSLSVRRTPLTLTRSQCGCSDADVPISKAVMEYYKDYTDHDLVLFVTARSNRLLSGDTLAFACSCDEDLTGRPTFGHINWGSNKIDFRDSDKIQQQIGVAIHEITHALGFANQRFERLLDTSKFKPGQLAPNYRYPKRDVKEVTLVKTEKAELPNGDEITKTVSYIQLPTVVEKVREHFGCDSMIGAEIENSGQSGTVGSHWEKRLFANEYMTGSSAFNPRRSAISLAMLQDTGWYQANFSNADTFEFGRGEGCDFVRPRCDKWSGPYRCQPAEKGHWGCTFDRLQRGICNAAAYTLELPPWYQIFQNNCTKKDDECVDKKCSSDDSPCVDLRNWGGDKLADFCPFFRYTANLNADCTEEAHQGDNIKIRGEIFGASSRCLDSTLLSVTKKGLKGSGGCFPLRCYKDKLYVRVINEFHDCSKAGSEITKDGFNGVVKCPPKAVAKQLCDDAPTVDSWPAISEIEPSEGPTLTTDDVIEIKGKELADVTKIVIGDRECTEFTKVGETSIKCKFTPLDEATKAPAPSDDTLIDSVTDFFADKKETRTKLDAFVILKDGRTGKKADAYTEVSSSVIMQLSLTFIMISMMNIF